MHAWTVYHQPTRMSFHCSNHPTPLTRCSCLAKAEGGGLFGIAGASNWEEVQKILKQGRKSGALLHYLAARSTSGTDATGGTGAAAPPASQKRPRSDGGDGDAPQPAAQRRRKARAVANEGGQAQEAQQAQEADEGHPTPASPQQQDVAPGPAVHGGGEAAPTAAATGGAGGPQSVFQRLAVLVEHDREAAEAGLNEHQAATFYAAQWTLPADRYAALVRRDGMGVPLVHVELVVV